MKRFPYQLNANQSLVYLYFAFVVVPVIAISHFILYLHWTPKYCVWHSTLFLLVCDEQNHKMFLLILHDIFHHITYSNMTITDYDAIGCDFSDYYENDFYHYFSFCSFILIVLINPKRNNWDAERRTIEIQDDKERKLPIKILLFQLSFVG